MFKNSTTDLNEYTTVVTDIIRKCAEECVPINAICVLPNQRPGWTRKPAIHWGPNLGHSCLAIQDHMWSPGMTSITSSRKRRDTFSLIWIMRQMFASACMPLRPLRQSHVVAQMTVMLHSLPDELNAFYAHFKMMNIDVPSQASPMIL